MGQCLRCSQPCVDAFVFCDGCRSVLKNGIQQDQRTLVEAEHSGRRLLRASRLAPLYDIAADIRRESTPMPATYASRMKAGSRPERVVERPTAKQDLGQRLPDLWPWLHENIPDESENDQWANRTDPLTVRHLPSSAEAALIEEEDMQRVKAEGAPRQPLQGTTRSTRKRIIFSVLVSVALLAVVLDSVLISVFFLQPHRQISQSVGLPTLTLSPDKASIGQIVLLHLSNFTPSAQVFLTHDIGARIQTSSGSGLIKLGPTGVADVSFLVGDNWGPGFHSLEAEDVTTRSTASTTLQVIGSGPARPAHLLIDTTLLDMGVDVQGTNTIQTLGLHNSGGGSISWAVSSNQPWLMVSPIAGTFGNSQLISVAVERK